MGRAAIAGAWLALMGFTAATALAADTVGAQFTLASSDFTPGGKIADAQGFNGFGCKGDNTSPALAWSNAPAGTQSFALLVHDPDAPTGSGWWHWVVYNLPANLTSLASGVGDAQKNLLPSGAVQGRTDFGTAGYGGPCPPPGKPHHYQFRLYALKVAFVAYNGRVQSLGSAELTGLYGR